MNLKRQNAQYLFVSLSSHDSISSSSECVSAQVLSNIFSKIVYAFNIYRYSQLEIMHLYLECQVRAKLQLLFTLWRHFLLGELRFFSHLTQTLLLIIFFWSWNNRYPLSVVPNCCPKAWVLKLGRYGYNCIKCIMGTRPFSMWYILVYNWGLYAIKVCSSCVVDSPWHSLKGVSISCLWCL